MVQVLVAAQVAIKKLAKRISISPDLAAAYLVYLHWYVFTLTSPSTFRVYCCLFLNSLLSFFFVRTILSLLLITYSLTLTSSWKVISFDILSFILPRYLFISIELCLFNQLLEKLWIFFLLVGFCYKAKCNACYTDQPCQNVGCGHFICDGCFQGIYKMLISV